MTNFSMNSLLKPLAVTVVAAATLFLARPLVASTLPSRITAPIDNSQRVSVHGMSPAEQILSRDIGAVDPSMQISGITLMFNRTPEQEAELGALISAQQDIHSPLYHQWLDPEQFGARFGLAPSDLTKVQDWLQQQGFTVDRVARASNHIVFSGTAGKIEAAFGAPIHNFRMPDGSVHFAPANDLKFPAAFASTVRFVQGLNTFRSRSRMRKSSLAGRPLPKWTSANGSYNFISPPDLATQYDINSVYKAGFTGAGQSIAVVGVSYILPTDISTFQSASGVPQAKAPIYVLVPSSGSPMREPGDESESDLDVEYSSTMAPGAQVYFVYTGANQNNGTDDATLLAVDDKIASIITTSYGDCELDDDLYYAGTSYFTAQDAVFAQGVAEGISLMAAAGDDGAADCITYGSADGLTVANDQSAQVDYPASSPYQTAMGATGIPFADYSSLAPASVVSTYWKTPTNGQPLVSSLIKTSPENVWNDDQPNPLVNYTTSAGGGGSSAYETIPTTITNYQAAGTLIGGVALAPPSIKVGKNTVPARMVPDISLLGSNEDPGLLYCSSDPYYDAQGNPYSLVCTNTSFYDPTLNELNIAGGTSFDGPIFAGILALINQATNSTGQGLVNPILYSIASSSTTTYASAFHDITIGSNACAYFAYDSENLTTDVPAPMPAICGVTSAAAGLTGSYKAVTGYDMASGLGTLDVANLIAAWPRTPASSLTATVMTSSAAAANPALSATDLITFTVTPAAATGTVTVLVDGVASGTPALVGGVATYSFSSLILGTHAICGNYAGDTTHAGSNSCAVLSVGNTTGSGGAAFTLAATTATSTSGSTGTSTLTVTAASNYNGTVGFAFTAPAALVNVCITENPTTVSLAGGAKGTTVISLVPNVASTSCTTGTFLAKHGLNQASNTPVQRAPWKNVPLPIAAAGLLVLVYTRRRSKLVRAGITLAFVVTMSLAGLSITGCSSSSSAASSTPVQPTPTNPNATPSGTYTITVLGADLANPTSLTNTTTFTYIVQ